MIRFVLTVIVTIIISNQATLATAYLASDTIDNIGIYGGEVIPIENAPFMVALWRKTESKKKYHPFCEGSIIHERFILTAAHCFRTTVPLSSLKVYIGSAKLKGKERVLHKVKKSFCRAAFLFDRFSNDICLLQLTEPVEFGPKVAKIGLPTEEFNLEQGTEVNVTGWGMTEKRDNMINNLRQATVPIVSEEKCNAEYKHLNDKVICAGSRGHDACNGDSGGPLTYNNIQIGLVSYGEICSRHSKGVGVYTRISSFVKWIEDTISENLP